MTKPTHPVLRALERWGAVLVAPRRTVAALHPDEGRRDGLILATLFVIGTSLYPMTSAVATVLSTHSLVALASGVARVLLTPILVSVLAETLLGGPRSYRGGLCLLPLVVVGTLVHGLALLEVQTLPGLWPDIVGGVGAAGLALWIRPAVVPERESPERESPERESPERENKEDA